LTFLGECDRIIVSLRKVGSICSVFLECFYVILGALCVQTDVRLEGGRFLKVARLSNFHRRY